MTMNTCSLSDFFAAWTCLWERTRGTINAGFNVFPSLAYFTGTFVVVVLVGGELWKKFVCSRCLPETPFLAIAMAKDHQNEPFKKPMVQQALLRLPKNRMISTLADISKNNTDEEKLRELRKVLVELFHKDQQKQRKVECKSVYYTPLPASDSSSSMPCSTPPRRSCDSCSRCLSSTSASLETVIMRNAVTSQNQTSGTLVMDAGTNQPAIHKSLSMNSLSMDADDVFLESFIRLAKIPYTVALKFLNGNGPRFRFVDPKSSICLNPQVEVFKKYFFEETQHLFPYSLEADIVRTILQHLAEGIKAWKYLVEDYRILDTQAFCESCEQLSTKLWNMGYGRKSLPEMKKDICQSLEILSFHLGTETFFVNNSPTELDCCAFSIIFEITHNQEDYEFRSSLLEFENLMEHYRRIQKLLWPEWGRQKSIVRFHASPERRDRKGETTNGNELTKDLDQETSDLELDVTPIFQNQYYRLLESITSRSSLSSSSLYQHYIDDELADMEDIPFGSD